MRMKSMGAALAAAALLEACSTTSVSELRLPNGVAANTVKCTSDTGKCFAAAAQSCPGGTYQAIASNSHAGGVVADIIPGPVTWYSMTYVCGASDGRMPDFPYSGSPVAVPVFVPPAPPIRTTCTTSGNTTNCTTR